MSVLVAEVQQQQLPVHAVRQPVREAHQHVQAVQGSLLECEEDGCDAVYLSRTGLRDHKSKIHQGKEFSCTACDFVSYRQGIINRHFKEEHIREVLHCNQCEYTTRILMNLRQHKYNKHKVQRKQRRRIGYLGEELGVEWSGVGKLINVNCVKAHLITLVFLKYIWMANMEILKIVNSAKRHLNGQLICNYILSLSMKD